MIEFIDSCIAFGDGSKQFNGIKRGKSHILGVMDMYGISKSVVFHAFAAEGDAESGNKKLISEIEAEARLIPQWFVQPKDNIADLISGMKKNGVKTVRIAPKTYGFSIEKDVLGELIVALSECRVPIFADEQQLGKTGIYNICKEYPNANFIITNAGYGALREYFSLLSECKNMTIETGNFVDHGGISAVCEDFGAERLVFGSCSPQKSSVGDARGFLMYSAISEEEKRMIASENIKKLLSEVSL